MPIGSYSSGVKIVIEFIMISEFPVQYLSDQGRVLLLDAVAEVLLRHCDTVDVPTLVHSGFELDGQELSGPDRKLTGELLHGWFSCCWS